MNYEYVQFEIRDRIATISLNRPERLNALNRQMLDEVVDAVREAEVDTEVRVIVLQGNGRAFSTGFDLADSKGRVDDSLADDLRHLYSVAASARQLWTSSKVTIAKLHGWCIAGGLMLGMNCDLVYAADSTKIGLPEARSMGISPEFGLWPLTINIRRTKELMLTGDLVTGLEAAEMGMINRALPSAELDDYVDWMAERLSSLDTETILLQKAALNAVADIQGLANLWSIGLHSDVLQHKQASRVAFAEHALAAGAKAAVAQRDDPFGGVGTTQSEAWARHRDRGHGKQSTGRRGTT